MERRIYEIKEQIMRTALEDGHRFAVRQLLYVDLIYSVLNNENVDKIKYYIDSEDPVKETVFDLIKGKLDVDTEICTGGLFEAVNKCQTREGKKKVHMVILTEQEIEKGINIESLRQIIDRDIKNINVCILLTHQKLEEGMSDYLPVFAQKQGLDIKTPYHLYYLVTLAEGWGRLENKVKTLNMGVSTRIYNNWIKNMKDKIDFTPKENEGSN